ncbi:MAG: histidine phosphatase family protein [Candidatus Saccharimonadales bacterium]
MKHLYFVRHGLSEANIAGVWSGTMETPLSAEGKQQAKLAGQSAKDLGIDHIISSPLSRAHDTAAIIAREIGFPVEDIELNSLLIERHFGKMEGQPWAIDLDVDGFVDVETRDSVLERARLTLEHLLQLDADTILVASHGSFGRALRHIVSPEIPFTHGDPTTKLANAHIIKLI